MIAKKVDWKYALLFGIPIGFFGLHTLYWQGFFFDDSYISFRYAENLGEGLGLVYNPGERVEGYSNFLWVLLSSIFERNSPGIGYQSPSVAPLTTLNIIAGISMVVWLTAISISSARDRGLKPSFLTCPEGLALSLVPPFAAWSSSTFEIVVYTLVVFAIWRATVSLSGERDHSRVHGVLLGVLLVAAGLLRIEGQALLLVVLAWVLFQWWSSGEKPQKALVWGIASAAAAIIIYNIWRVTYFGSFIPNVVLAKTGGPLPDRLSGGVNYLVALGFRIGAPLVILLIVANLSALRRHPASVLAFLLGACHIVPSLLAGGDWAPGYRLLIPILPFFLFLTGESIRNGASELGLKRHLSRWSAIALLLWLVLSLTHYHQLRLYKWLEGKWDVHQSFREWGLWLRDNTTPGSNIACMEIGYIGYFSERPILDLAGLTDPEIAALPGRLHQRKDIDLFLERSPDYALLAVTGPVDDQGRYRSSFLPYDNALLQSDAFHQAYEEIMSWERPEPGETESHQVLYRRVH